MTCVCSLAGTAACKTCWHNPDSTGQSNNFVTWTTTSNYDIQRKNEMSYEDALILLDELGLSERTCKIKRLHGSDWSKCSECYAELPPFPFPYSYCPNCGAKVVEE